ncbi:murein hydrolase activator EnvC family protein [Pseudomonadota bacterium]
MPRTEGSPGHWTRMPGMLRTTLLVLLVTCFYTVGSNAQNDSEQQTAETRLKQIQVEIKQLQNELQESRAEHRTEQDRLRELDLRIQSANLDYRDLEKQRKSHLAELAELEIRKDEFLFSLEQRHDQLAEQIRASYRLGRQSRLKLVLNQDSPAQLGRMMAYYDYINRAQIDRISDLRAALLTLERMQESIDAELIRLEGVQKEQSLVLKRLDEQRSERRLLLAELAGQISSDESRLRELQRNRQDLETLISRLANVLADIPADLGQHLGVASRKGRLPMPVEGPVVHAFGQTRGGGLRWQGWMIEADAGQDVIAVAYGRVAFSDWLRGYGLLIIIDHGEGFMSLYGHNESLLHEAGDWVEPGEAISVVGTAVGNSQGLYFELRKNGKAIDPAAWLSR